MRAIDLAPRRRTSPARLALAAALATALAAAPAADSPLDRLDRGERGVVTEVVDGDTLAIAGGPVVRLVGVQAPKLALGRDFEDWPLADRARETLLELVQGREVTLRYGGVQRDRYRRALAHLERDDGLWVQRAMIEAGMAWVYSFADNRALLGELIAAERAARDAGRGVWAHRRYRVRAVTDLDDALHAWRIVEGRVVSAADVRGRLFVNFGDDWRTDFTITVAPRDRRMFEAAWIDAGIPTVAALAGHRVRVRGWLEFYNGPSIVADHPEQIEILAPAGPP